MPDPYVCFRKKKVSNLLIQFNKTRNTVIYREDNVNSKTLQYCKVLLKYLNTTKVRYYLNI